MRSDNSSSIPGNYTNFIQLLVENLCNRFRGDESTTQLRISGDVGFKCISSNAMGSGQGVCCLNKKFIKLLRYEERQALNKNS